MNYSLLQIKHAEDLAVLALPILLKVLAALAIFFIGMWLARALSNGARKLMRRSQSDEILVGFVGSVLYAVSFALVVIAALGQLGVNTNSATAIVGGAALAIGLSLQNQLASFAAGVLLIVFRPFRKGDLVTAGGITGVVEEIKIVVCQLRTADNQEVTLSNAAVWGSTITNFTTRPFRCADLSIGISYDSDLLKAKDILTQLMHGEPRVLENPKASVQVKDLTSSQVILSVRPWFRTEDYVDARCDLLERIKLTFDVAGIKPTAAPPPTVVIQRDTGGGMAPRQNDQIGPGQPSAEGA
jgi:small conductance mechanosensitive channel